MFRTRGVALFAKRSYWLRRRRKMAAPTTPTAATTSTTTGTQDVSSLVFGVAVCEVVVRAAWPVVPFVLPPWSPPWLPPWFPPEFAAATVNVAFASA